jgi:uncharacterized protein YlbG (UPF0298 family)
MLSYNDFKNAYDYAKTLSIDDERETTLVQDLMPHHKYSNLYTRSARIKHIKRYLDDPSNQLDSIVSKLPSMKYVKEWLLSGLSKIEQDTMFKLNINVNEHSNYTEDELERKSIAKAIEELIAKDDFISSRYSNQEHLYIMRHLFPRIGLTSPGKYSLFRGLYMMDFINSTHIEMCIDNDNKINQLVRIFVTGDIPKFSCDPCEMKNEIVAFIGGEWENLPSEFNKIRYEYTAFAKKVHEKKKPECEAYDSDDENFNDC